MDLWSRYSGNYANEFVETWEVELLNKFMCELWVLELIMFCFCDGDIMKVIFLMAQCLSEWNNDLYNNINNNINTITVIIVVIWCFNIH